jgi:transposase
MTDKMQIDQVHQKAITLRRAGKSRREIMQILGVGHSTLDRALRGVPPPTWTRRPRAKDDLRAQARVLRALGYTYAEIVAELGVSKGTVSLWVRDMPRVGRLSEEEWRQRNAAGVSEFWRAEGLRREVRRQAMRDAAAAEVGPLTDREIIIAGAVAYWCEGSKSKPHCRREQIDFINSDARLIELFLRFLDVVGVGRDRLICRLSIHESGDVETAQKFWMDLTGLPPAQFRRPTLKRHNPTTVRKNVGEDYRGCLVIKVRRSAELYRQVEGWASAAMAGPERTTA